MIKLKLDCLDSVLEVEQPVCCKICLANVNKHQASGTSLRNAIAQCTFCKAMKAALKHLMQYQQFDITFNESHPNVHTRDSNPGRDNYHMPVKSPVAA